MNISKLLKFTCISILASTSLHAITLKDSVEKVLVTNPEVIAEKNNQKAFRKYIDERRGDYYPRIDIDGTLEKSNTDKEYDSTSTEEDGSDQEDGYNFGIALNQMLYDGDLTPSRVREAKHNELANKYRTRTNIENVVLETINAYTGLVQYNELLALTKGMIVTNEENLEIAKEKESISGEVLETYQVDSKLNFIKEKYLEEKDLKSSRTSTFKRYIGVEASGNECRPSIDLNKIPTSLQKAVELAVLRNNEILEQIERIKAQRELIAQADAAFLPNLSLELKALTDNDLSLDEEGVENQVFGRINLAWNLYNGGGDYAVSKQEELFLAEQKDRLDALTNKIVETAKVNYQRFMKNKDRIEVLKKYVAANENIVDVYKSEFEAGTRTFVDILNAQTELYEAKASLVNREYALYSNYYQMLNNNAMLSETILASEQQSCSSDVNTSTVTTTSSNTDEVAQMLEETTTEVKEEQVSDELNVLLGDDVAETVSEDKLAISETQTVEPVIIPADAEYVEYLSFLDASPKAYTINITTTKGLSKANEYVASKGLDAAQAYTYEFGPGMKSAKVIYGTFNSVKEAKVAIANFSEEIKAGKPYIDNISKHQKLYKKYH
ncbi:MAG: transporter [Arcobacter sp.]|nr:transporter [Arcobacter sp.]|tara:strand:- start:4430 stop:6262 length:1833 start_codon:yes stop_codon:yes gene_type:complete